ncbi:MAG: DNA/RNA non-specific endonuclease [Actinomycetia bacterium]|nr:DNA/RNA non-specific endonuclease [Actinomycetes bacterium]
MAVKAPSTKLKGILSHINPKLKFDTRPFDRTTIGKLKANATYVSSRRGSAAQYIYTTDAAGRIKTVTADPLVLKASGRARGSYTYRNPAGKQAGDDSGHLIADRFDGAGSRENIVAQLSSTNQGAWKDMEKQWADALSASPPKTVKVEINVQYGAGGRPIGFDVKEWIDGVEGTHTFPN